MTKIERLQVSYENICSEYVDLFLKKQDMEYVGWVANDIGGILMCSDFFFNFKDIVWDINTEQPKGLIVQWYYDSMQDGTKAMNYYNYTRNMR